MSDSLDCSSLVPLSMGFSRQEYWRGLSFPSPEDIPDPGIEPWSPALESDSLPSELSVCLPSFSYSGEVRNGFAVFSGSLDSTY